MATKKISELTALTSPDGAEELLINDGGTSKKITITNATASKLPLAGGTMTGNISHASHFTLDVGGNITLDADNGFVKFADGGTDIAQFAKGSNSNLEIKSLVSDADILFQGNDGNSAITAMTIDMSEGGNVGIGTTSAQAKLHIMRNDTGALNDGNVDELMIEGTNAGICLGSSTTGEGHIYFSDSNDADVGTISYFHTDNYMRFRVNAAERMRLDSSGNVEVSDGTLKSGVSGTFSIHGGEGTAGNKNYATYGFKDDPNTGMYRAGADTIGFTTAGIERMRIHSDGDVTIGSGDSSSTGGLNIYTSSANSMGGDTIAIYPVNGTHAKTTVGDLCAGSSYAYDTNFPTGSVGPEDFHTGWTWFNSTTGSGMPYTHGNGFGLATSSNNWSYTYQFYKGYAGPLLYRTGNGGNAYSGWSQFDFSSYSDERMKENVESLTNGLNIINQIEPVYFDYTEESSVSDELRRDKQSGVIAQQIKPLVPECITYLDSEEEVEVEYEDKFGNITNEIDPAVEDPMMIVEYKKIIPYLIGAVKELSTKCEDLQDEIDVLKNQ